MRSRRLLTPRVSPQGWRSCSKRRRTLRCFRSVDRGRLRRGARSALTRRIELLEREHLPARCGLGSRLPRAGPGRAAVVWQAAPFVSRTAAHCLARIAARGAPERGHEPSRLGRRCALPRSAVGAGRDNFGSRGQQIKQIVLAFGRPKEVPYPWGSVHLDRARWAFEGISSGSPSRANRQFGGVGSGTRWAGKLGVRVWTSTSQVIGSMACRAQFCISVNSFAAAIARRSLGATTTPCGRRRGPGHQLGQIVVHRNGDAEEEGLEHGGLSTNFGPRPDVRGVGCSIVIETPSDGCALALHLLRHLLVRGRREFGGGEPVPLSPGSAAAEHPGQVCLDVEPVALRGCDDAEQDRPAAPAFGLPSGTTSSTAAWRVHGTRARSG